MPTCLCSTVTSTISGWGSKSVALDIPLPLLERMGCVLQSAHLQAISPDCIKKAKKLKFSIVAFAALPWSTLGEAAALLKSVACKGLIEREGDV